MLGLFTLSSSDLALAAHPIWLPPSSTRVLTIAQSMLMAETSTEKPTLPTPIQQAVLQDLSKRTRQPVDSFQIMQADSQTWPDGCLGLSEPDVLCTMALVPGWQVVVSDGSQQWTYRTDDIGQVVKLDPQP